MSADSTFNKALFFFTELQAVDSTNNYAMQQLQNGLAAHGSAWFAHRQTQGKGQRNKEWISPPGENIIMSAALDTGWMRLSQLFEISVAVALAVHDFFNKYSCGDAYIKWPNDIYWCDRKAAGILIENIIQGNNWQFAVAGIGININQTLFSELLQNPVSLKQITGKNYEPVEMAKELCIHIFKRYEQLKQNEFEVLLDEYNSALYKRNEMVRLKKGNRVFETIIKCVNRYGQLVTEGAFIENFEFGEVEWVMT